MPGARRAQKKVSNPLGLELQMFVSRRVGAGSRGPLEEQLVFFIMDSSLQSQVFPFEAKMAVTTPLLQL